MNKHTEISEAEFLKNYDASKFDRPSFSTDILIFSISNEETENYRKLDKKHFSILLVKRDEHPFLGQWSLPGGFVKLNESLEDAVSRVLLRETNLKDIYTEQLYTFGNVDRDPRTRVITSAYMALMDKTQLKTPLNPNAEWFNVEINEDSKKFSCKLSNGRDKIEFSVDKSSEKILKNSGLAFDHPLFIVRGLLRLRNKIEYTDVAFNVLPELFSLTELQHVYETILGKTLLAPAFRRIIQKKVEKTKHMRQGAGHRPAVLFRKK